MNTINYTFPADVACILFYGDESGSSDDVVEEINDFIKNELNVGNISNGIPIDVTITPFFCTHNDLNRLGANCLEFTFEA
jgi:hypothetical protein